jgi:hypothetical protein
MPLLKKTVNRFLTKLNTKRDKSVGGSKRADTKNIKLSKGGWKKVSK